MVCLRRCEAAGGDGVVDALCFGSEAGDIGRCAAYARCSRMSRSPLAGYMADTLATGVSYPAAYSEAVRQFMAAAGDTEAASFGLEQPNNTLGLHYLLALERIGSAIEPTRSGERKQYRKPPLPMRKLPALQRSGSS